MERIKLSEARIMETMRGVVAERPEYVYTAPEHMVNGYESCFYVHKDSDGDNPRPGCLVGVVLNRLGVPLEELDKWEGTAASIVAAKLVETSSDVVNALDLAQAKQDTGGTWADALAAAEAGVPEGVLI